MTKNSIKVRKMKNILNKLTELAKFKNLPIIILQHGSSVYAGKDQANDLDLYIIASSEYLKSIYINTLMKTLKLEVNPLLTYEKDTEDLVNGKITRLLYQIVIDSIILDIKITTLENIINAISQAGKRDYITRIAKESFQKKDMIKELINYKGLLYQVTYSLNKDDTFIDKKLPGVIFDSTDVLIVSSFYENMLTSNVVYEQTPTQFKSIIEDKLWEKVIKSILFYNNLYEKSGKIKSEAYDQFFVVRIFKKKNRFSPLFISHLKKRYFLELDKIDKNP